MLRIILSVVGGVLALPLIVGLVMVLGLRTKYAPVVNVVRRVNRAFWNPRAMKTAGQPGAYSVIRHVGRKSGTPYETPVGVEATEDGFVIGLPYGTSPDWLKNVMGADSAVVVHEGETYSVGDPRVVSISELSHVFSSDERVAQRLFGVDQALTLHTLGRTLDSGQREDRLPA